MAKFDSPLTNLKVASPCSADWEAMAGDERTRFCGDCKLNVYNLSGMTKYDAENLLRLSEGRLCVRYVQRADGSILTQDCPVGWAKMKQRVTVLGAAVAALLISFLGTILVFAQFGRKTEIGRRIPIPFATPTPKYYPTVGVMARPSPTPKATPTAIPKSEEEMVGKVKLNNIDPEIKRKVLQNAGA